MRIRITITGTAPFLMHNIMMSDPLNPTVREMKKITSDKKFKNTDEGIEQLARLEFAGGLYHDADMGPYLPSENITGALVAAAKATRQGKTVSRALLLLDDSPLAYEGPRDIDGLWADVRFRDRRMVKVGTSKVARTRARFDKWRAEFDGDLDTELINLREFAEIAELAGRAEGVGDYRPRFGRFVAEVTKL